MSLVLTVNRREMYRGVLGTHPAALTIHVSCRWGRTRVSIAYVSNETMITEVIG